MPQPRRRATQGATIRDVALHAGVSPMTVSRVINKESHVRADTRAQVEAAIRDLDYTPSPAARSLAGSSPCRIGLLYDNPSTGYLSEFLIGALDASSRTGAQLIVEKCTDTQPAEAALNKLLKIGVDGLILPPPLCESPEMHRLIRASGTATVAVAPGRPQADMAAIRIDNEGAARELTEHLLKLGHRRFGFIKGHPNQTVSAQRLKGFLSALKDAGIKRTEARIEPGYFTYRSGLEATRKLLAGKTRPTAILAANDDMASAAMSLAHRMGLEVPADLSIVGFDDTPMASAIWPPLTTIHQPIADMARAAVDLVLEEIRRKRRNDEAHAQLLQAYRLVTRESSGPAPARSLSRTSRA